MGITSNLTFGRWAMKQNAPSPGSEQGALFVVDPCGRDLCSGLGALTRAEGIGWSQRGRRSTANPALLASRGFDGEAVHHIVHWITGMPLDPSERHITAGEDQFDERFPEITVGHGLLL